MLKPRLHSWGTKLGRLRYLYLHQTPPLLPKALMTGLAPSYTAFAPHLCRHFGLSRVFL